MFYSTYSLQLVKNLKTRNPSINIDIVTAAEEYKEALKEYNSHVYLYRSCIELAHILHDLPKYKTIHLLWMENVWAYFANTIKNRCDRLIVNVGGSDFYRSTKHELEYKNKIVSCADYIAVESEDVREDFIDLYHQSAEKIRLLHYGIENLDLIKKNKNKRKENCKAFGLDEEKVVVVVGHNACKEHQHKEIIHSIDKLKPSIKEKIVIVLPMTYPPNQGEYIEEIVKTIQETGVDFAVIDKYMTVEQVSKLDAISDVMVHMQTTDSMSSSMIERLYAGCIVINGAWLPYGQLEKMGLLFEKAKDFNELEVVLEEVIKGYHELKKKYVCNEEVVYRHFSWDYVAKKWVKIWGI